MAARRPCWKWRRWKSIGFCLWPPSTCIWNLKLKFQSKLDLCSGNHVVYRRTDGRTDGRTRWMQYTPPPTSLGGGTIMVYPIQHWWHLPLKMNANDEAPPWGQSFICWDKITGSTIVVKLQTWKSRINQTMSEMQYSWVKCIFSYKI